VAPLELQNEIAQLQAEISRNQSNGNSELARILLSSLKEKVRELNAAGFTYIFSDQTARDLSDKFVKQSQVRELEEFNRMALALENEASLQPWFLKARVTNADAKTNRYLSRLSSDNKLILTTISPGQIDILDAMTGKKKFSITQKGDELRNAIFSPNCKQILTYGNVGPWLQLWDANSGSLIRTIRINQESSLGNRPQFRKVVLSPDGQRLAILQRYLFDQSNQIGIFDIDSGRPLAKWSIPTTKDMKVASSIGGKYIAVAPASINTVAMEANFPILVYSFKSAKLLALLPEESGPINSLSISSDSSKLISISAEGHARIWNLSDLESFNGISNIRLNLLPKFLVNFFTNWHSENRLKTSHDEILKGNGPLVPSITLKSSDNPIVLAKLASNNSLAFTIDSSGVATFWEPATGKLNLAIDLQINRFLLTDALLSHDGNLLAVATNDGCVCIWNTRTGSKVSSLVLHSKEITSISFTADDNHLIISSLDSSTSIWHRQSLAKGSHQ
jgi:WD40 repeat protein